jgi:hypothetical protein
MVVRSIRVGNARNLSVIDLKKEYRRLRAVIGRYCSNLSRRPPPGEYLPFAGPPRTVSFLATETAVSNGTPFSKVPLGHRRTEA